MVRWLKYYSTIIIGGNRVVIFIVTNSRKQPIEVVVERFFDNGRLSNNCFRTLQRAGTSYSNKQTVGVNYETF